MGDCSLPGPPRSAGAASIAETTHRPSERVSPRQHYRRRLRGERDVQRRRVLLERPKDETNTDARVASLGQFPLDSTGIGISRPYQAETAGIGDGGGQTAPG